jgi:hypothetical protein
MLAPIYKTNKHNEIIRTYKKNAGRYADAGGYIPENTGFVYQLGAAGEL